MKRDIKTAFGHADARFEHKLRETVNELKSTEGVKVKRKISISMAAAIAACLLLAAVALAAAQKWGVLDFVGGYENAGAVLPGATGLVQSDVAQTGGETANVVFSVREAVRDESHIYVVVEARAKDAGAFITNASPNMPASDMGETYAAAGLSVGDYYSTGEYTGAYHVGVSAAGEELGLDTFVNSYVSLNEDDATVAIMLDGDAAGQPDDLELTLNCMAMPIVQGDAGGYGYDYDAAEKTTLTFTLPKSAGGEVKKSTAPVEYADCGVRVDSVTLTASDMATYAEITFTVIDEAKYAACDDGLWFEFIDENGERLKGGASGSGGIGLLDDSGAKFVQKESLLAMEKLPDAVTLQSFNCWTKERYEKHDIPLN